MLGQSKLFFLTPQAGQVLFLTPQAGRELLALGWGVDFTWGVWGTGVVNPVLMGHPTAFLTNQSKA